MEQVERIVAAQVTPIPVTCIVEPLEYGNNGVDDNKKTELFLPLTAKPGNLVEHENGDAPFVFRGVEDAASHDINYSSENIYDDSNNSQSGSSFSPNDAARVDTQGNFMKTIFKSHGPPQLIGLCLLMALAGGSVVGVVPAIVTDRCARLFHGYTGADCSITTINSNKPEACRAGSQNAQNMSAWAGLMSNGLTFLTSTMTGSLSDHHGRRPFILCGMGLACISPICLVLLVGQPNMNPHWYFITTATDGLVNWFAVALSALPDVIPPKWRAPSFGLLPATFAIGYAIGPSLALQVGHDAISFLSCALVCATFVLAIFWYPETLPKHVQIASRERARREENDFVSGSVTSRSAPPSDTVPGPDGLRIKVLFIAHCVCRPIREMSILNRSYTFRMLSLLAFFSGMVGSADGTFIIYYAEDQLDFNDKDIAFASLISGIFGIILQGILLKPFNECVGERRVLIVSFCFGVISNVLIGLATTKCMFGFAMVLSCVLDLSFATISAIKSINISEHEQGRIQGALYSLQALAWAVGPLGLRAIYTATVDTTGIPGFMFLVGAMLYVVAVICAYLLPPEESDSRLVIMPHDTSETARRSSNGVPTNRSLEFDALETPLVDDASRPR